MPPTIDIVRHAQSRHNVEPNGDQLRDPSITATGADQAAALGSQFPFMKQVKRVISSPMRRAVQTALIAFEPHIREQGLDIVLLGDLQEASARPSDTGSPPRELREEFGSIVNVEFLADDWWFKDASASYGSRDQAKVADRARKARLYIRNVAKTMSDDDHIVVVAHSGFVRHLIQGAPKFGNAEFRPCQFVDLFGDDDQALLAEVSLKV
ncbi:histidine phosphatase superfamily [Hypoxylon argillaceum]|nr:histidine phosphatase superfamily [Hypoxylon argillaceum]